MEIKSWEEAQLSAEKYAALVSEAERIEEALKEFCLRRHDQVGRERSLGAVLVGFRKVPASVAVSDGGHDWLAENYKRYIITVEAVNRAGVRELLRAHPELQAAFASAGILYREATEAFYVKLARKNAE